MEQDRYPEVTCRECGKRDRASYMEPTKTQMVERQLCFACNFWLGYVEKKDDPQIARVEGTHYYVNPKKERSRWNGFGGSLFHVRWMDGREEESNDVWCQGDIPERFRERLPDNAEFLK